MRMLSAPAFVEERAGIRFTVRGYAAQLRGGSGRRKGGVRESGAFRRARPPSGSVSLLVRRWRRSCDRASRRRSSRGAYRGPRLLRRRSGHTRISRGARRRACTPARDPVSRWGLVMSKEDPAVASELSETISGDGRRLLWWGPFAHGSVPQGDRIHSSRPEATEGATRTRKM